MRIDMHSHFAAPTLIDYLRSNPDNKLRTRIVVENGTEYIHHLDGFRYPHFKGFNDYETICRDLDRMHLDKAVLSCNPSFFYYWIEDIDEALKAAQMSNDWIAQFTAQHPDRIDGMITVPMQNIPVALEELKRAHTQLGLRALSIACNVNGKHLDCEEFFPIYEYCSNNSLLLYLHPCYIGPKPGMTQYYLTNILANPFETTQAIDQLIYGGVFEKFPNLKLFTSHAGGFFPFQYGRVLHGYDVRSEPKERISKSPDSFIGNLYFDTITHSDVSLKFLIDNFGADHVMLGTDYPFDMGDFEPVERVERIGLTDEQIEAVVYSNANRLTGVK